MAPARPAQPRAPRNISSRVPKRPALIFNKRDSPILVAVNARRAENGYLRESGDVSSKIGRIVRARRPAELAGNAVPRRRRKPRMSRIRIDLTRGHVRACGINDISHIVSDNKHASPTRELQPARVMNRTAESFHFSLPSNASRPALPGAFNALYVKNAPGHGEPTRRFIRVDNRAIFLATSPLRSPAQVSRCINETHANTVPFFSSHWWSARGAARARRDLAAGRFGRTGRNKIDVDIQSTSIFNL